MLPKPEDAIEPVVTVFVVENGDVNNRHPDGNGRNAKTQQPSEVTTETESLPKCALQSDGGYGWVCVGAQFLVSFIVFGNLYNFGLLFVELIEHFNAPRSEVAWVGSISIGIMYITGPIAAVATSLFSCAAVCFGGSLLAIIGLLSSAYAPSTTFLFLTFGTVTGIGFGMMFLSAVQMTQLHFDRRRGLAGAMASVGASVGTLSLAYFYRYTLDTYTWRGTMKGGAGLASGGLLCALLYIYPERTWRNQKDSLKNEINTIKEKSVVTKFWNIISNKDYIVFQIGVLVLSLGVMVPFVHIPDVANLRGIPKDQTAHLVSLLGISGMVSRLLFGYLGDRPCINRQVLYGGVSVVSGVSAILLPFSSTFVHFTVYCVIAGGCLGFLNSAMIVIVVDISGAANCGFAVGIQNLVVGATYMVGSPLASWLHDLTGTYDSSFYLNGSLFLFGACLILIRPVLQKLTTSSYNVRNGSREEDIN